jgi:uncharacterized membrane protein
MRKLGPKGMRWLKIFHLISVALWFGGISSLVILIFGAALSSFEEVSAIYSSMRKIDELLIRNGGQGILITSLIYSIWTHWGFFKHKWVTVKWGIFALQMVFGIGFLNRWVGTNVHLLETEKSMALSNPIFIQNHSLIQIGTITQALVIIIVIGISVIKPWKKKDKVLIRNAG